jgi:hypothetical protein
VCVGGGGVEVDFFQTRYVLQSILVSDLNR